MQHEFDTKVTRYTSCGPDQGSYKFTFGNDVLKMKVDNSSHRQECPYPLIKFWIDLEVKVPLGVIFLTMFYLGMWSKYLDLTAARLFIAMMKESYSRTVFAPIRDYSTAI